MPKIEGMAVVTASKDYVVLGTNSNDARISETPEMKVELNYSFLMGIHEVTCGEYNKNRDKKVSCENDSLPVANVTYYDAVLYANEKSKELKFDTVYTYSDVTIDEMGRCLNIQGLAFHPEAKGFRLPTEAEWIRAATADWEPSEGWNNENSDYKVHKVCEKAANKLGFCDMAGNVVEWVNDWLGKFKDTTVVNYVGGVDGGSLGERVVKGGSYMNSPSATTLYGRGDTYSVTSTSMAEYVGFRLAFGSIPDALWLDNNGSSVSSPMVLQASSDDVKSVVKTYSAKLAFRNDMTGNLAYVDYKMGGDLIVEIQDTIDVYHPEISPDGNKVAFCTNIEGVPGNSSLYVRNLDESGSDMVKLDVKSAAIPRWRVSAEGDTSIVYVDDTGDNENETTWKTYGTWEVPFADGKFGTPVKLMDGSFHGGVSSDNRLAVTGSRLLRARLGKNVTEDGEDEIWFDGKQACNVSLSNDGYKQISFLDLGKSAHEKILIADSAGQVVRSVRARSGFTFDHTEWASDGVSSNIVATLANTKGAHTKIVLVNMTTDEILDLVDGQELWHPNLWIKKKLVLSSSSSVFSSSSTSSSSIAISSSSVVSSSSNEMKSSSSTIVSTNSSSSFDEGLSSSDANSSSSDMECLSSSSDVLAESSSGFVLDADSAGAYYDNESQAQQWRYAMELLWTYKDVSNIVILGSSRPYNGVIPRLFSEPNHAINLSCPKNTMYGSLFLTKNYVLPHVKNLKYLIIGVDIDRFVLKQSYSFFDPYPLEKGSPKPYTSIKGYVYDENHNFWKDGYPEGLKELTSNDQGTTRFSKNLSTLGYYSNPVYAHSWPSDPKPDYDANWREKKSGKL